MKFKWQHIEFIEGNPYICKTEKEFKRVQKKYKLVQIKDGFWKEKDMKDLDVVKIANGISNPSYRDNIEATKELVLLFNRLKKEKPYMIYGELIDEGDYIKTYDDSFYTYQTFDDLVESEKDQSNGLTECECVNEIDSTIFLLPCGWYVQYV